MGKIIIFFRFLKLFSFLFILYDYSIAKSVQKNCSEIDEEMGFYLIKYTYVKFTGTCLLYNNSNEVLEIMNFKNGLKDGSFTKFFKGKISDKFYMKNNKIDGTYKKFKEDLLYKKLNYENGKLIKCFVDLKIIMNFEQKLKKGIFNKIELPEIIKLQVKDDKENCELENLN